MKNISRRGFFGGAASATLAGNLGASAVQEAASSPNHPKKQPNLIFFMPDELRADALSCYGNPVCRTPNLDRLASEGTRFAQCHIAYPVCGAVALQPVNGLAHQRARAQESLLFSPSAGAQLVPISSAGRLRCVLVREERRASERIVRR